MKVGSRPARRLQARAIPKTLSDHYMWRRMRAAEVPKAQYYSLPHTHTHPSIKGGRIPHTLSILPKLRLLWLPVRRLRDGGVSAELRRHGCLAETPRQRPWRLDRGHPSPLAARQTSTTGTARSHNSRPGVIPAVRMENGRFGGPFWVENQQGR